MEQITHSPLPRQDRRRIVTPYHSVASPAPGSDLRWHLLDLVRITRERLRLRDRDIAVLRGLLSLLPKDPQDGPMMVFASNRVLIARCDGIDERTLRRRLSHLQAVGLVARNSSPNGKRYQIRSADDDVRLSYGISLEPLFALLPHLEALADLCQQEALEVRALRAVIRDRLFHHATAMSEEQQETARLALRRKLGPDDLRALLSTLPCPAEANEVPAICETAPEEASVVATQLTVSNGQNDRHIQISGKENSDSEKAQRSRDITVEECLELASTAKDYVLTRPQSWPDLMRLSEVLGPAIGVPQPLMQIAKERFGMQGCALVVLGLVEAFGRIRSPGAYLQALLKKTSVQAPDPVRMFHSLVRPGRAVKSTCIPG